MANKRASREGSIRQRPDGRWEARYTVGTNPGTGKPIRKSIYGDRCSVVAKALRAATAAVEDGTYAALDKITVGQWLDLWVSEYCEDLKPRTIDQYKMHIRLNLKPYMGAVLLSGLSAHTIQSTYNRLRKTRVGIDAKGKKKDLPGLSPKSIKNLNGVLHASLDRALKLGYIRVNPADSVTLPRVEHKEMHVIGDDRLPAFLEAIKGDPYEAVYLAAAFTGMRQGELLGLQWPCVDLDRPALTINKQLQKARSKGGTYSLVSTKTDRARTTTPSQYVTGLLREQKRRQAEWKLRAGALWDNRMNLVFTNELGSHLCAVTLSNAFKRLVRKLGMGELRFHDLRHTFATLSLQNGDDYKTVQTALGHTTPVTTLAVYGHVTQAMQKASADRMDAFIQGIQSGAKKG